MRSTTTFSITFFIRKLKSSKSEGGLYCRITYNSKPLELSLKRRVPYDIWDAKRNKLKGHSNVAKALNQYINEVRTEMYISYEELRKSKIHLTVSVIKSRFLGEDPQGMSLIKAFEYHNSIMTTDFAPGTIKHYNTSFNHIKRFLKEVLCVEDILLQELTFSFVTKFEHYMRTYVPINHHKPIINNNTVMKHIQRLRKVIGVCIRLEWLDKDPFHRYEYKFTKSIRTHLSEQDLTLIMNKPILIGRLLLVRDLFIFSCYTGLSYIDVIELRPDNILKGIDGEDWIITNRHKTGTQVKIPLLAIASQIIGKYRQNARAKYSNTLFPKISNQKLNSYLKELADICGINKNLTFHVARHTFATTVTLSNGVPISTVSKLLGHTKIATTQIYAKVLEHKVSEDINILRSKLKEESQNFKNSNQNIS